MLPNFTGLQTCGTEGEAIMNSISSTTTPITSHDSEIPKSMDVHVSAIMSSNQPVNENANSNVVLDSFPPFEIVDATGCVSSLNVSLGDENLNISISNAKTTNDHEKCIENHATTTVNSDSHGTIDDAVACRSSNPESTSSRALAAKTVESMTTANLSDYLNKQCISHDDTKTSDLTPNTSFDVPSRRDVLGETNDKSHLKDGQDKVINVTAYDNLDNDADEEIKIDVSKNDTNQGDVKSLPTVINNSTFGSLTNQCCMDNNNTDAFSSMRNLNDTAVNDVAISADAETSFNATSKTKNTVDTEANVFTKVISEKAAMISSKLDDLETGVMPPSFISKDDVASHVCFESKPSGQSSQTIGDYDKNAGDIDACSAPTEKPRGASIHNNATLNGAKHSLSKDDETCQNSKTSGINKLKQRGSGWGTPAGLGLRGGGETSIANGASGWGPPPQPNTNVARGWGQPPATNVATGNGTGAWGNSGGSAPAPIATGWCGILS